MIVGPDPEKQLEPFADHVEVERYQEFLTAADVSLMAEEFALSPTDLAALARKMPEWQGEEGGVADGRLFFWTKSNPQSKYDWYALGGRFDGFLRLRHPAPVSAWRRLLGGKPSDRANQARKGQVDTEALVANPPSALLMDTVWRECPFSSDPAVVDGWKREFALAFAPIPEDALLTIMDLHS
jgi:hypothetical protein